MKTIMKVEIEPVFVEGYMPPFETMEEKKIYISEEYQTSIHRGSVNALLAVWCG